MSAARKTVHVRAHPRRPGRKGVRREVIPGLKRVKKARKAKSKSKKAKKAKSTKTRKANGQFKKGHGKVRETKAKSKAKKSGKKGGGAWVAHVKAVQKKHGISYTAAMKKAKGWKGL